MSVQAKVDKVAGKAEELAGKAREKIADATGDTKAKGYANADQARGLAQQAKGHVEDAWDKTKDVVKKATSN